MFRMVQSHAKQKHERSNPGVLRDYYIGVTPRFDSNRAQLEQSATAVLLKLETDPLPGVTAAKKLAFSSALDAYKNVEEEQSGGKSATTSALRALEVEIAEIAAIRREFQHAADGIWPPSRDHDAIRREFRLPLNRRMK
jgi:hypothetical protein